MCCVCVSRSFFWLFCIHICRILLLFYHSCFVFLSIHPINLTKTTTNPHNKNHKNHKHNNNNNQHQRTTTNIKSIIKSRSIRITFQTPKPFSMIHNNQTTKQSNNNSTSNRKCYPRFNIYFFPLFTNIFFLNNLARISVITAPIPPYIIKY